jgi:hypothetical protein
VPRLEARKFGGKLPYITLRDRFYGPVDTPKSATEAALLSLSDPFRRLHLKRKRKSRKRASPLGIEFNRKDEIALVDLTSMFQQGDRADFERLTLERARQAETEFNPLIASIRESISAHDTVRLLTVVGFLGTLGFRDIKRENEAARPVRLQDLELTQAFALSIEATTQHTDSPASSVRGIVEKIRLAQDFHSAKRFQESPSIDQQEAAALGIMEDIRHDTQLIRFWGYGHQIRKYVRKISEQLDPLSLTLNGFAVSAVMEMLFEINDQYNRRLHSIHLLPSGESSESNPARSAKPRLKSDSNPIDSLFRKISQASSVPPGQPEYAAVDLRNVSRLFSFKSAELEELANGALQLDEIRTAMRLLSHHLGDLQECEYEHFFLSNPVWSKPFIQLDPDTIFVPNVTLVEAFPMPILEALLGDSTRIRRAYFNRRSSFLEEEAAILFQQAFPQAKTYRGSKWMEAVDGVETWFENDLLVVHDVTAIIVECKAGSITPSARRGALLSLNSIIEKLVLEPAIQSKRFQTVLMEPRVHEFVRSDGGTNVVDTRELRNFLRVSITLDSLSTLFSRLDRLIESGLVESNAPLALTMTIAELENVFTVLPSTVQRLHYLYRRCQMATALRIYGDEMDLLGLYCMTGFALGELENPELSIWIYGLSDTLHPFMLSDRNRWPAARPTRRLTRWWSRLLNLLERHSYSGWTDVCLALLDLSAQTQNDIQRAVSQVLQDARRASNDPLFPSYRVFQCSIEGRQDLVVVVGYRDWPQVEKSVRMSRLAAILREDVFADRIVLLGFDTRLGSDTLDMFAFSRSDRSTAL